MTRTPRWFQTGILVVGIGLTILVVSRAEQIAFDDQVRSEQHLVDTALAGQERSAAVGHATFMSPHAAPIAVSRGHVFVVNTPGDTVDVIDVSRRAIVTRVNVGIDPVGIAVRPDGNEVWVANHVSDSVSVIDSDRANPTYLQVIATIQDFDPKVQDAIGRMQPFDVTKACVDDLRAADKARPPFIPKPSNGNRIMSPGRNGSHPPWDSVTLAICRENSPRPVTGSPLEKVEVVAVRIPIIAVNLDEANPCL